jgi:hypothetical protein
VKHVRQSEARLRRAQGRSTARWGHHTAAGQLRVVSIGLSQADDCNKQLRMAPRGGDVRSSQSKSMDRLHVYRTYESAVQNIYLSIKKEIRNLTDALTI